MLGYIRARITDLTASGATSSSFSVHRHLAWRMSATVYRTIMHFSNSNYMRYKLIK